VISATTTYPHVQKADGAPAALARLPRVRVAQIVMDYLAHGWSADEICRQHSYLTPAETHSAMAYYFDHQMEIHAEILAELAIAQEDRQRGTESPVVLRLRARSVF
jgi:uncharacterized protein (DUF433 family)